MRVLFQTLSLTPDVGFQYHLNKMSGMSVTSGILFVFNLAGETWYLSEQASGRVRWGGTFYLLRISGPHSWLLVSQEITISVKTACKQQLHPQDVNHHLLIASDLPPPFPMLSTTDSPGSNAAPSPQPAGERLSTELGFCIKP